MSAVIAHAAPAEVNIASEAVHVGASTVLLDSYFAVRTLAYILKEKETPQSNGPFIGTDPLMPGSLAREARLLAALRA